MSVEIDLINKGIIKLVDKRQEVLISIFGGQVISWKYRSFTKPQELVDIFYVGSEIRRSGMPVLFPFADPLKDGIFQKTGQKISRHGFARDNTWDIERINSDNSEVKLSLSWDSLDISTQNAYPYPFKLEISYSISSNPSPELVTRMKVFNVSDPAFCEDTRMPISPGLHPYFFVDNKMKKYIEIELEGKEILGGCFGWDSLTDGKYFDWLSGRLTLAIPNKPFINISQRLITSVIGFNGINPFEKLVLWSQNNTHKDSNFVCIEPFAREQNAINIDPIIVEEGTSWESEVSFLIKN